MKARAFFIAIVIASVIVVFSVRNPELVLVDMLIKKISIPLSLALFGAAAFGAVAGGVLVAVMGKRRSEKDRIEKREK